MCWKLTLQFGMTRDPQILKKFWPCSEVGSGDNLLERRPQVLSPITIAGYSSRHSTKRLSRDETFIFYSVKSVGCGLAKEPRSLSKYCPDAVANSSSSAARVRMSAPMPRYFAGSAVSFLDRLASQKGSRVDGDDHRAVSAKSFSKVPSPHCCRELAWGVCFAVGKFAFSGQRFKINARLGRR